MSTVFFGVTPDRVKELLEASKEHYPGRQTQVVPFANVETKAPAKSGKYKGYHQIKINALIPEDAIKGENAILDFGGFLILDIEKNRVADHLNEDSIKA
ncbi:hypothetical protein [Bacillus sp. Marseille-P3800]|uniref:hypothetical protein n=1 Tax=Bacillus sp. Marseille-P3800 TaxID=2014782 RepID=UPI000C088633|nr:hypothetical protein [Bacillus sp. Marseille-P3800]